MKTAESIAAHEIESTPTEKVVVASSKVEGLDAPVAVPIQGVTVEQVATYYLEMGLKVLISVESEFKSLGIARELGCTALAEGEELEVAKMSALDYHLARYRTAGPKEESRARTAAAHQMAARIPTDFTEKEAATKLEDNAPRIEVGVEEHLKAVKFAVEDHQLKIHDMFRVRGEVKREVVEELDESIASSILASPGVTLLKTPTASGKSSKVVEPLFKQAAEKGLHPHLLSPLISIARGEKERLERDLGGKVSFYSEIAPGEADRSAGLVSVINSALKAPVKEISRKADVLVLEEGEKILQAIADNKHIQDKAGIAAELEERIRAASRVVIADADISDVTLEFIKNIRSDVKLIEMEPDHEGVEVEVFDAASLTSDAKEAYAGGSRIIMLSDSKKDLKRKLSSIGARKQEDTLLITGENKGLAEQDSLARDPDSIAPEYRVLAFTPALASSVSITEPCFDEVYAFAHGTLSALEMIQMIRRYRPATKIKLAICAAPEIRPMPDVAAEAEQAFGELGGYEQLFAKIKSGKIYSKKSIYTSLPLTLRAQGFKVTRHDQQEEERAAGADLAATGKQQEEEAHREGVLAARDLDPAEAAVFEKSDQLTDENVNQLHRFHILRNLGRVDEQSIQWWGQGSGFRKLRLLRAATMTEPEAGQAKAQQKGTKTERFDYIAARQLLSGVFSILGVSPVEGGRFTREQAVRAAEFLQDNARAWNALGITRPVKTGLHYGRGRAATFLIGDLLSALGLSKEKKRVRVEGRQTTAFEITNAELVASYLAHYTGRALGAAA